MKSKILLFGAIAVAVFFGWLFRPYPQIDPSKVHPALRNLPDSAPCGWTSFSDGGSLSIDITRPDGTVIQLSMSNSTDQTPSERGQLYIGASHYSMPGATKITGYDHTRFVVAKLLARDIPKFPYIRRDIALMSKHPVDWASYLIHMNF